MTGVAMGAEGAVRRAGGQSYTAGSAGSGSSNTSRAAATATVSAAAAVTITSCTGSAAAEGVAAPGGGSALPPCSTNNGVDGHTAASNTISAGILGRRSPPKWPGEAVGHLNRLGVPLALSRLLETHCAGVQLRSQFGPHRPHRHHHHHHHRQSPNGSGTGPAAVTDHADLPPLLSHDVERAVVRALARMGELSKLGVGLPARSASTQRVSSAVVQSTIAVPSGSFLAADSTASSCASATIPTASPMISVPATGVTVVEPFFTGASPGNGGGACALHLPPMEHYWLRRSASALLQRAASEALSSEYSRVGPLDVCCALGAFELDGGGGSGQISGGGEHGVTVLASADDDGDVEEEAAAVAVTAAAAAAAAAAGGRGGSGVGPVGGGQPADAAAAAGVIAERLEDAIVLAAALAV